MQKVHLNSAHLENVLFYHSQLSEVNFLHATAEKCSAKFSTFTDTVFGKLGSKFEFFKSEIKRVKPIFVNPTALGFSAEWGVGPARSVQDNGGAVMPFEYSPYKIFDGEGYSYEESRKISKEIIEVLNEHRSELESTPALSILFDHAKPNSNIEKVKNWVIEALDEADGVILHGGHDVGEVFYNKTKVFNVYQIDEPMEDLVEGFSVMLANRQKKAIMGVCRGAQMVNTALGGSVCDVDQRVSGSHSMDIYIPLTEKAKRVFPFLEKISHIFTYNAHDQQCDEIAEGLETIIEYRGVPKVLLGNRVIATQFHPEEYPWISEYNGPQRLMDDQVEANKGFYKHLVAMATDVMRAAKKVVISPAA